jgi:hypothetical protein
MTHKQALRASSPQVYKYRQLALISINNYLHQITNIKISQEVDDKEEIQNLVN